MIYLRNLTDYTLHLLDNYNVHVTIITGKILYTVTITSCYTCYMSCYTGILITDVDVVTVTITELSQWSR